MSCSKGRVSFLCSFQIISTKYFAKTTYHIFPNDFTHKMFWYWKQDGGMGLLWWNHVRKFQTCVPFALVSYKAVLKSLFQTSFVFLQGNMWSAPVLHGHFTFFVSNLTSFKKIVDVELISNFDYFLSGLYVLGIFQM